MPIQSPAKICTLCSESMHVKTVITASGASVEYGVCMNCDRRRCKKCDRTEPTGEARSCPHCQTPFP